MYRCTNKNTGKELIFDHKNYQETFDSKYIEKLISSKAIDLTDLYNILIEFNEKDFNEPGVFSFAEKLKILTNIEATYRFDLKILKTNYTYQIALCLREVIRMQGRSSYASTKIYDLKEIYHDLAHNTNHTEALELFYDLIDEFQNVAKGFEKSREDCSFLLGKLNNLFSKVNSPTLNFLKGFYMLILGHLDKAVFSFDLANKKAASIGKSFCRMVEERARFRPNLAEIGSYVCEKDVETDLVNQNSSKNDLIKKISCLKTLYESEHDFSLFEHAIDENMVLLNSFIGRIGIFDIQYATYQDIINNLDGFFQIFSIINSHLSSNQCNDTQIDKFNIYLHKFIEHIQLIADSTDDVMFRYFAKYYIGRLYHSNREFIRATKSYKQSDLFQAKISLCQLEINHGYNFSEAEIQNLDVINCVNLINFHHCDRKRIILNNNSLFNHHMRAKKSETCPESAIFKYFELQNTVGVKNSVIYNNIAFFFILIESKNDTHTLQRFSNLINFQTESKNHEISSPDRKNSNQHNISSGKNWCITKLKELEDDISKYNLSFLVSPCEALNIVKTIKNKEAYIYLRIAHISQMIDKSYKLENYNELKYCLPYIVYNMQDDTESFNLARDLWQKGVLGKGIHDKHLLNICPILVRIYITKFLRSGRPDFLKNAENICKAALQAEPSLIYMSFFYVYIIFLKKDFHEFFMASKAFLEIIKNDLDLYRLAKFVQELQHEANIVIHKPQK